jgi:hypothetical protein
MLWDFDMKTRPPSAVALGRTVKELPHEFAFQNDCPISHRIQSNRERCDRLFDRVLMEFAAHALGYLNAGQFSHSWMPVQGL